MSTLYVVMKENTLGVGIDSAFASESEALDYCHDTFKMVGNGLWTDKTCYIYIEKLEFTPRVYLMP